VTGTIWYRPGCFVPFLFTKTNASFEKNAAVPKLVGITRLSITNFKASGRDTRNASMGQGCGLDGSVAAAACCKARNSSPVPTTKPLCDIATMSEVRPPESSNRIAMPRGPPSGELSAVAGSGDPSENRIVTATGAWK